MRDLPLGQSVPAPDEYAPDVLAAVPRADARRANGIDAPLPFEGVDVWNAWELSWLDGGGRPRIATAEIRVPADSPALVESKSLKLYLGSYAMTVVDSAEQLAERIASDLEQTSGAPVEVLLAPAPGRSNSVQFAELPGRCIDELEVEDLSYELDADLLAVAGDDIVNETLHSHLLRSLCPVTGQPDFASISIEYRGPRIDHAALLRYLVSFRRHQDFHEACVERIFIDLLSNCHTQALTVFARYTRRGGIDINPFRTNDGVVAGNGRLWRQ